MSSKLGLLSSAVSSAAAHTKISTIPASSTTQIVRVSTAVKALWNFQIPRSFSSSTSYFFPTSSSSSSLSAYAGGSTETAEAADSTSPLHVAGISMISSSTAAVSVSEEPRASSSASLKGMGFTKVVTDIDDTVVSSGGVKLFGLIRLGGVDIQYKRGQFYPGVIQFALELSKPLGIFAPPKVAVLTARAREFKFALALKPNGKLSSAYRRIGMLNGIEDWGIGDVYYGSVAEWVFQWRKGIRKFQNFEIMMDSKENQQVGRYILVGDTGEKDEEAGERIAAKYPDKLRAVFLHSVSDSKDRSRVRIPADRTVNGVPVIYFRTYVGAAIKAYNMKLIEREAVVRIAEKAVGDLQDYEAQQQLKGRGKRWISKKFADARGRIGYNRLSSTATTASSASSSFSSLRKASGEKYSAWRERGAAGAGVAAEAAVPSAMIYCESSERWRELEEDLGKVSFLKHMLPKSGK